MKEAEHSGSSFQIRSGSEREVYTDHMSPKSITIIVAAVVAVALAAPAHAQVDCADWNTGAFFEAADVSDVTRCLLAGADPNAGASSYSYTPLHMTARRGDAEAVVALLEAGADPNAGAGRGHTPLYFAATAEIVEALLAAGADPNAEGHGYAKPRHCILPGLPKRWRHYSLQGRILTRGTAVTKPRCIRLRGVGLPRPWRHYWRRGRTRTRAPKTATPRCIGPPSLGRLKR